MGSGRSRYVPLDVKQHQSVHTIDPEHPPAPKHAASSVPKAHHPGAQYAWCRQQINGPIGHWSRRCPGGPLGRRCAHASSQLVRGDTSGSKFPAGMAVAYSGVERKSPARPAAAVVGRNKNQNRILEPFRSILAG